MTAADTMSQWIFNIIPADSHLAYCFFFEEVSELRLIYMCAFIVFISSLLDNNNTI